MNNNLLFDICEQRKKQQINSIPPIRINLNPSLYEKGYTKQQLDMRRKAEILKYSSNLQSNQTNNLTQKEKFSLSVKTTYNTNIHIISNKSVVCPNKHTPTSSCDIPGPNIDIYCDNNIPLYNFIGENYTRPYGIIQQESFTPWDIHSNTDVVYSTTDGLLDVYGEYNICATVLFKYLIEQKNIPFYLITPISLRIEAIPQGNIHATHTITIKNIYVSVFYDDIIISTNNNHIENHYNIPKPIVDITSLKPLIFDVSTNGNIQLEQYLGILKVSNLVLFYATGYIYDIKLSFQIQIDTVPTTINTITNYQSFKITAVSNILSAKSTFNNCILNSSSPKPGTYYPFYLLDSPFVLTDIFNLSVYNPTYNSVNISFEKYDPKKVIISAYSGNMLVSTKSFNPPFIMPILYNNLLSDMSYHFILTSYDYNNNSGQTIESSGVIYTLSNITNLKITTYDSSSILIDFSNTDLSYIQISANNSIYVRTYNTPLSKPILYNGLLSGKPYNFTVTPYNYVSSAGISVSTISPVYTLSNVSNILLNTFDSRSIQINFDNSDLSYVSIRANIGYTNNFYGTANIYSYPFVKPILFQGLQPDVSYSFVVTPYNNKNQPGKSIVSTYSKYTLSIVGNLTYSALNSSTMLIQFDYSNLKYVFIRSKIGNRFDDVPQRFDTPFTIYPIQYGGLISDTSYSFDVTPYNHASVAGATIYNSNIVYTLSFINNITLKPFDSRSVDISFARSDLSYVKITANIGFTNNQVSPISNIYYSPFTTPIRFNGLKTDISYSFIVTPYNHGNVAGTSVISTDIAYTLNTVSNVVLYPFDSSSINVYFEISDLSYAVIYANNGSSSISKKCNKPDRLPVLFNFNDLLPDVSYSFTVVSYNLGGIAGIPVTTSNTAYTFSSISNIVLSNIGSSSIDISFIHTDLSYVKIQANIGNTNRIYGSSNIYSSPFIQPIVFSGLQSDSSYTFIVTPYNHGNLPGFSISNNDITYTLSTVSNIKVSPYDSSSILIDFSNSDLSYVMIQANYGNSTVVGNTIWNAPLVKPLLYTGLIADMCYNFIVTPYNHANIPAAGFTIMNTPAIYTLSYVNNVTLTTNDSSSILIDFSNSDLSYVMIQANYGNTTVVGNTIWSKPLTKPLLYKGLIPDMCYNFIVTPYNHASTSVAGFSATNSSAVLYTLSYVYNMKVSPYDSSSMLIDFSNSDLSYVSIQAKYGNSTVAGNTIWSSPLSKPLIYNGLIADMCYNFIVTPYNHANIPIAGFTMMNTPAIYTFSYVNNVTLFTNDSSSILIDFSNSDLSYVMIQAKYGNATVVGNTIWSKPLTKPLLYKELIPDMCYNFFVTPYNHANISDVKTTVSNTSPALYTFSYVNNVTLSTNDSSSIFINFSNSDLSYVIIQANYGNTTVVGNTIWSKPLTKPLLYKGLIPDMCYNFIVTPYNHASTSVAGFSATNSSAALYTLSYVYNMKVSTYDSSSMLIDFSNSDLSYVSIQAKYGNSTVAGNTIWNSPLAKPLLYTGLIADMCYNFIVTPYNHANIPIAGFTIMNTPAIYTLSYVNNVTLSTNDSSSILIDFSNSDLSYVMIQANYGNSTVVGNTSWSKPLTKPLLYTGLIPDMCYNFFVTPYNHANISVAGLTATNSSTALYTFSYVYNMKVSPYDSSSMLIDFSNSDLSYVSIQAKYGNAVAAGNTIWSSPLSKPLIYNGLIADMCYNFIVTPYNHATTSIAGFTIMNTPAIYTLSYVNNVTLTVNDSSSILIDFGNSDLSYVSIQANVGNTTTLYGIANLYSKPFTKPIVFQGLQSDVSYTFNVIPYNNANVGGTPSGNIIALYTWAYVNNVTLRANDSSSILIDFSNSDLSYVSIQANVGNTTTLYGIANLYSKPFTKPIVFQGLQADMSYTFNVTPYNNANINGKTIGNNITVYTFSKVTNIMVYPYDSSSLLIDFSNTDLSYITCQAYKGNTTTPYGIANIYSTPFTPPILFKGLQTDVSYSFIVTPYNHDNKAGTYVGNNNAIYTLSTVSNISYSPYDTNDSYSMNINFDNSDLSYVSIQANIGNTSIPYGYPKIFSNPLLKPILYTGLEPDVSYSFIVTPYNHGSIPGFTKGNTTAVCTLSFLSTIMLRIKNSSSVEITFDKNSNLSYIDITTIIVINNNTYFLKSNIFNNPFSSITISPPVYNLLNIIIDGLNFGSTYYFIATPYNHDNIPGTSLISANITF